MKKSQGLPYAEAARLVMSAMAGHPLRPDDEVRHINGDVTDCRPENLELACCGQPVHWLVAHARWILAEYGAHSPS